MTTNQACAPNFAHVRLALPLVFAEIGGWDGHRDTMFVGRVSAQAMARSASHHAVLWHRDFRQRIAARPRYGGVQSYGAGIAPIAAIR